LKLKGFIYAIVSAVFFGTAGIFVKEGSTINFGPVDLLILQYIIATVILTLICIIKYRSQIKLSNELLKKLLIQSIFGNTLMSICFYSTFKYLDVSVGTMLLYIYPALVALYSFLFLEEKISRTKVFSIVGTFFGSILVLNIFSGSVNTVTITGIILGILSAVFYAFMNIYSAKIVEDVPPIVVTFYTNIFSLVALIVANIGFLYKLPTISSSEVIHSGLLAVFCEIVPLTLLFAAIKHIGAVTTSIISTIELPAATILSFIFLGERLEILQIVGIFIVVYSIIKLKKESSEVQM
jgi:drug/metabolite transporter (DMT)-like permease